MARPSDAVSNLLACSPLRRLGPMLQQLLAEEAPQEAAIAQLTAVWQHRPPPAAYLLALLKALEKLPQATPVEGWYTLLPLALAPATAVESGCHWRTFTMVGRTLDTRVQISLKETQALTSRGTTGLRTWGAAVRLAHWLLQDAAQRHVGQPLLELGAGTGLVGWTALASGAAHLLLTDHHADVIAALRSTALTQPRCRVEPLDWLHGLEPELRGRFPLVVAADVVFEPALLPALLDCLCQALMPGGQALVASTVRNADTFGAWVALLESAAAQGRLTVQSHDLPEASSHLDDFDFRVVLHEVTMPGARLIAGAP